MVRRLALTGPSASCSGNAFYSSGTFFEGSEELTAGYSSSPCILLLENSSYWLLFARHAPSLLADQSHIDLIFRKSCMKSVNLSHQKTIEMYQLSESGNKSWFLRAILLCPEMVSEVSTFNNQVLKKKFHFSTSSLYHESFPVPHQSLDMKIFLLADGFCNGANNYLVSKANAC